MGTDLCGPVFPIVLYFRELHDHLSSRVSQTDSLFFFYWCAQKEAWFSYFDFMVVLPDFTSLEEIV